MPKQPPKKRPYSVGGLIQLALRIYLLLLAPMAYFQRSLIYHPSRCPRLVANHAGLSRDSVDVLVRSHDGLELNGWLVFAGFASDAVASGAVASSDVASSDVEVKRRLSDGQLVVLYFPGNAGNRSMRHEQIEVFGSLNAHVMIFDYRGYGDNSGKPSEVNFQRDARAIWNHLTQELGVASHRVVIYGESLGGGVATRLASDLCSEGIEPGGLVVQSTFSSLVAAAQAHFPIVPVSFMLIDRYRSDVRIRSVTCPILQIHGKQDSIVSFANGQQLFDSAPRFSSGGIPKRQVVLPNSDHNDVYSHGRDRETLIQGLTEFLKEVDSIEKTAKSTIP